MSLNPKSYMRKPTYPKPGANMPSDMTFTHYCLVKTATHYANSSLRVQLLTYLPDSLASRRPGIISLVLPRSGLANTPSPLPTPPDSSTLTSVVRLVSLVYNGSYINQWIEHDQRIAQLIIVPLVNITIVEVKELSETGRGSAGFGSTGA